MNTHVDFAKNLKLLCSYFKSIAEVCRRLSFNRAQFNRYLNGQHKPSANTMLRICEFFGVEEFEIMLPHNQFKLLIQVRPKLQEEAVITNPENEHLKALEKSGTHDLDKYLGYYFEYYMSMAHPGKLLRTLVCFEKKGQKVYYQRTERIIELPHNKAYHCIYLGMASFLVDRIFMVDYESLTKHEISQTILFPTFKNRISQLKGLKIGVSGSGERMPICTRVIYEYLGASINVKKALSLCGLYNLSTNEIDDSIKLAVKNDMADNEVHFRARH
ncbi:MULTISPECIES: helix-turn-helix domain-containing protein [Pseudoalteromonas]|uniref:helix-turn-helix domain-containing protein n=1 Tax=Pseudoalteromonas TaxID=53246 RepID=UPI000C343F98|nr:MULTISPECIES: helix-turn-helix transcriptional regulator [Pseudoalteromonas]PKG63518.1 transcriptional regulator [Pseudoalteromonas arctica]PKG68575.1 transcriptional regulator [Pseudoalteromonas sp. GutCa3]PKG68702.1 transcriptional regulator [Pseudoalteromonas sp. GutCa3]